MILTLLSLYNLFLRPYHSILFLHLFCFILLSLLLTIKKYRPYQILGLCDSETHSEKGDRIKPLRTGFNPCSFTYDVNNYQVGFTFVLRLYFENILLLPLSVNWFHREGWNRVCEICRTCDVLSVIIFIMCQSINYKICDIYVWLI